MDVRASSDAGKGQELIVLDYETYNLDYVLALAQRFHTKGYKIYLDYRKAARSISEGLANNPLDRLQRLCAAILFATRRSCDC